MRHPTLHDPRDRAARDRARGVPEHPRPRSQQPNHQTHRHQPTARPPRVASGRRWTRCRSTNAAAPSQPEPAGRRARSRPPPPTARPRPHSSATRPCGATGRRPRCWRVSASSRRSRSGRPASRRWQPPRASPPTAPSPAARSPTAARSSRSPRRSATPGAVGRGHARADHRPGRLPGLPATLHVTYAQLTHTPAGCVVTEWAPQKLDRSPSIGAERRRRGLGERLALAYSAGWTVLVAVAGVCAAVPGARWFAHHELALALHVRIAPRPRRARAAPAWILVDNIRATGWPLLAVARRPAPRMVAERHARRGAREPRREPAAGRRRDRRVPLSARALPAAPAARAATRSRRPRPGCSAPDGTTPAASWRWSRSRCSVALGAAAAARDLGGTTPMPAASIGEIVDRALPGSSGPDSAWGPGVVAFA